MFIEKLNKRPEGVYVIEEEKAIANGIWEGYLDHDNINHQTIYIYTGPKLTGEKVENFFISTPSETPWKTHLKVYSSSEKIYITYETTGDQVEAEDINLVQNTIADTVKDLADYKATANADISDLKNKTTNLQDVKANTTYVDVELNKKYDKEDVFNKDEVLQKIQDLIGAAPEALDTLGELARALDNDPDFATNLINQLSTKVDKIEGKRLSDENYSLVEKNKLAGIEDEANKYTHPSTHAASMITESVSRRFVSDTDKSNWNTVTNKADKNYVDTELDKKANAVDIPTKLSEFNKDINFDERYYTEPETDNLLNSKVDNSRVLTDVPTNAKFTDTVYTHPSTHAATMITESTTKRFVSDVEKANWNDANSKKHTHSNKSILDKITQALIDSWNSAVEHIGDGIRHITSAERTKWNAKAEKADIPTKVGQLENDKNYVTQSELGNARYGDMMKSTYDKNDDGIVDKAESVPWSGVTGKPSTFPPSSHNHDGLYEPKNSNIQSHISNKSNPHSTTKSDVGLGNVLDYGIATQAIAETGVSNSYYMTPLRVKQAIEKNAMSKGPLTWNELKGV